MKKIIVIVGPTGVGKTKLSIELAKRYHGEIINADAMQIYKHLNIGTAKITKKEMENIPHHLFDIKEIDEEYSIYQYQKDCRKKIVEIQERQNTPILVGGTGLYIKSALYDYHLTEKNSTNSTYEHLTNEELYQKLIQLDKNIIDKIDRNNRRRLINALNYFETNHQSISENKTNTLLYDAIFIGLTTNRENLYQIINNRVDKMIEKGLIEEIKPFYQKKIQSKPLSAGIGYKELYPYLDGLETLKQAIDKIKQNSRRYAKRQYTFFNHQLPVKWFETNYTNFESTINNICAYLNKFK